MTTAADGRGTDGTRPISALGRPTTVVAGGKGADIGELARAEFRFPPGFVVGAAREAVLGVLRQARYNEPLASARQAHDPTARPSVSRRRRS